jgi:hypothetical protein
MPLNLLLDPDWEASRLSSKSGVPLLEIDTSGRKRRVGEATSTSDSIRSIRYSFRKLSLPFPKAKHTSFVARSRVSFHRVEVFDKCDMSEGHHWS